MRNTSISKTYLQVIVRPTHYLEYVRDSYMGRVA
jgi:hypothetical protein